MPSPLAPVPVPAEVWKAVWRRGFGTSSRRDRAAARPPRYEKESVCTRRPRAQTSTRRGGDLAAYGESEPTKRVKGLTTDMVNKASPSPVKNRAAPGRTEG